MIIILLTLDSGNYDIFLILGSAGSISPTVISTTPKT